DGVFMSATRGMATPKGVDPERIKVLSEALEKAVKNQEQVSKMEKLGIAVKYMNGSEYQKSLKDDENSVKAIFDLLGWK
ncbi:hypothetical protein, partial [Acinetobacter baumannii]|uniref:hypothetical protein n=1 Tax=Acinetobacter baumannii TaxID=470 RepID=UPI00332F8344